MKIVHKLKGFALSNLEYDPEVVVVKPTKGSSMNYDTGIIQGKHYRISPTTPNEVFLVQCLEHHHEKFAPARGNGIIVTASAFNKLTA